MRLLFAWGRPVVVAVIIVVVVVVVVMVSCIPGYDAICRFSPC